MGAHVGRVLALDGRLHRDARPAAAHRQADDRPHQRRLRRRRQRAPDRVRPVGHRRRRATSATWDRSTDRCRPAARRSGCRSSSATGARARSSCSASRSRRPRRSSGGSCRGSCSRERARRGRGGSRRQAARGSSPRRCATRRPSSTGGATWCGPRPSSTPATGWRSTPRADETREAVAAFHEKRTPRFAELRRLEAGEGRTCPSCGASGLPATHRFCGLCGTGLPDAWEAVPMTDEQLVLVERQPEQRTALVRLNRPKQLNALNGAVMDALCDGARGARPRRGRARDRGDRQRASLRRGRGHRRDGRGHADRHAHHEPHRPMGPDSEGHEAGDRRGQRLGARRRLRAGDDARPHRRRRGREVRPARDQHRRHPGCRRNAATDPRDRQGEGDDDDPDRRADHRARGARAPGSSRSSPRTSSSSRTRWRWPRRSRRSRRSRCAWRRRRSTRPTR